MLILTKLYDWMIWLIKSYLSIPTSPSQLIFIILLAKFSSEIISLQIYFLLLMIALRMKFYIPSCHECDIKWQLQVIQGSLPLAPICRIKLSFRSFELYGKSLNFLLESLLVCLEIQRILIILFIEIIVSRIPFIARNIIIFITPFLNTATKTLLKLPKLQTTVTSNLATFYRSN